MSVYEELHYKDSSPDATVDRLLKILQECGIDTEEAWGDKRGATGLPGAFH